MSAEIIAVPVPYGNKEMPGNTHVVLQIVAFQPVPGTSAVGEISAPLASKTEIDRAVEHIIEQAKKAGEQAKRILHKAQREAQEGRK